MLHKNKKQSRHIEVSVVMPAFNEEKSVGHAVTAVLQAFDDLELHGELIVVDDGSVDATKSVVRRSEKVDERVRLIAHETNQGIGKAFWTGVDLTTGTAVTMLPGDNENDPIEKFDFNFKNIYRIKQAAVVDNTKIDDDYFNCD